MTTTTLPTSAKVWMKEYPRPRKPDGSPIWSIWHAAQAPRFEVDGRLSFSRSNTLRPDAVLGLIVDEATGQAIGARTFAPMGGTEPHSGRYEAVESLYFSEPRPTEELWPNLHETLAVPRDGTREVHR